MPSLPKNNYKVKAPAKLTMVLTSHMHKALVAVRRRKPREQNCNWGDTVLSLLPLGGNFVT